MGSAKDPAARRYNITVLVLMTGYVLILTFTNWMFIYGFATGTLAYLVAALPALPIIGVFAAIGRLIVEMRDEYMRMRFIRQILIATAFTLSVTTVWGFLESVHLVPHVEAYYAAMLWFAGLGVGSLVHALSKWRGAES